jgi:hypothetical protein
VRNEVPPRSNVSSVGSRNIFLIGLFSLTAFLTPVFAIPQQAKFPIHDFLDHVVTLNMIWARETSAFDYFSTLPLVLGGGVVPGAALGIPDLSFQHFMYRTMEIDLAVSYSEIVGRLLSFVFFYFFLIQFFRSKPLNRWAIAVSSVLFALMPYGPSVTWSMVSIALAALSLALITSKNKLWLGVIGLFIAPQISPTVAWGSFLVPTLALAWVIGSFQNKKNFHLSIFGLASASLGFLVSGLGLILLNLMGNFTSHRLDWPTANQDWFDPQSFNNALSLLPSVFLNGDDQFKVGNLSNGVLSWLPGVPMLFTAVALIAALLHVMKAHTNRDLSTELYTRNTLTKYLAMIAILQLAISLIYVSEVTTFTQFYSTFSIPFQISRVVAFSPFLWSIASAVALTYIFSRVREFANISGVLALLISLLISPVHNASVRGTVLGMIGIEDRSTSTVSEYFRSDDYNEAKKALGLDTKETKVLSFGLDPMIAVMNGLSSLDGYVYNYPLYYKRIFREIISVDASLTNGSLEYFDTWGSRLYIFDRGVAATDLRINWCASVKLGAEYLFSSKNLSGASELSEVFKGHNLIVYRILPSCLD